MMQTITVLLAFCCLASAQEASTTDTADTTTQGVDWDAATSTRRGRYATPRATPDYTTLFDNQWGPAMMNQVATQPYGTRLQREEVLDFFPFLRRPDGTPTVNATQEGMRHNVRRMPHPGMFYYPRPDMAEILRYSIEADPIAPRPPSSFEEGEEKQNVSASSPPPFYLGVPGGRLEDGPGRFPYPMFGYPPMDYFYRRGGAYPYAMPPMFYPPPQVPRNEDRPYPDVEAFDRSPFDRESGPEPAETIVPVKEEAPPVVEPIIPRQPLPPFPFGLLPPGQFPIPPRFLPPTLPPPTLPPSEEALLAGEPLPPPQEALPAIPQQEAGLPKPDGITPPILPTVPQEAVPEVRIPYEFGYDMNDGRGTDQHRQEISDGSGSVTGSYGYRDAMGVYRVVNYVADKNGFRAFIKSNEPGVANPGSADVVVMAEVPPPATIAEGLKQTRLDAVEIPDVPIELLPPPADIK